MRNSIEKTIWLDIDDTIAVTWPIMVACGMDFCEENRLNSYPDFSVDCCEDGLYFADILHLQDEHLSSFFAEKYPNYLSQLDPTYGAKEFLHKLKDLGYKINLISSRRDYDGRVEQITRAWLSDNGLPYDTLVVSVKDKASYLINEKGFFIDDSYGHCTAVNEKTSLHVIQKRSPFSKGAPGVFQAYFLPQIFEHILAMERNNADSAKRGTMK